MAIVATVQSGNASNPSTWSTGALPNDGDTIVISPYNVLTWDLNWSSAVSGNNFAVSGTFLFPSTMPSGSYGLVLNGNITVAPTGSFLIGSAASPIPTGVVFTCYVNKYGIILNHASSGNIGIYGTQPPNTYALLVTSPSNAATGLLLDRDVSNSWQAGELVCISYSYPNWSHWAIGNTIMAVAPSGITIASQLVPAGYGGALPVPKYSGVIPCASTVRFIGAGNNTLFQGSMANTTFSGATFYNHYYVFNLGATNTTINNCVLVGWQWGVYGGSYYTLNNTVITGFNQANYISSAMVANNCVFVGNSNSYEGEGPFTDNGSFHVSTATPLNQWPYYTSPGTITLNNSYFLSNGSCMNGYSFQNGYPISVNNCTFVSCTNMSNNCLGVSFNNCTASGCGSAIQGSRGCIFNNCKFINNGTILNQSLYNNLYSCSVSGTTTWFDYQSTRNTGYNNTNTGVMSVANLASYLGKDRNTEWGLNSGVSWNGLSGDVYFNSAGGSGITQAPPAGYPTGMVKSLHCSMSSSTVPLEFDMPVQGTASTDINLSVYVISSIPPSSMISPLVVQLVDPMQLYMSSASYLASGAVGNGAGWQTIPIHYTPAVTAPLLLRVTAINTSGSYDWGFSAPSGAGTGTTVFVIESGY